MIYLIAVLLHPPKPVTPLDWSVSAIPPTHPRTLPCLVTHSQLPSSQVVSLASPGLSFSREITQGLSHCSTPAPSSNEKAFSRFTQNRRAPHFLSVLGHAHLSGLTLGQNKDANEPLVNFKNVYSTVQSNLVVSTFCLF